MAKFTIIISMVILIAALFLLFNKIFTPQPIQIVLESGQEVTTSTPEYFSLAEVLLMVISSFLIGAASIYLFYNSDIKNTIKTMQNKPEKLAYDTILPLLKQDERKVILILRDNKGEMHQNKLVANLNLSKVKVTRILHSLKQKDLIIKERHGFTNLVKLNK